jgi:hypothetical protein
MTPWTIRVACALLVVAPAAFADNAARSKPVGKGQAININAKELKWGDAPPDLPKGAKVAVLYGDPSKAGPFTIRLKAPDGFKVPPHWHSHDEQLTVMSGTLVLHMGDTMKAEPHVLEADGFHFLPGKMHHGVEMKGETVVQIAGTGPFDIHYPNPTDNPNPKSARR